MKSLPIHVGNVNMRGKRTKALGCGCCVATNLREPELKRMHEKEIKAASVHKCVCYLRGTKFENSHCGQEFEAHPRIFYPTYCGNKTRKRTNCGHAPHCHEYFYVEALK